MTDNCVLCFLGGRDDVSWMSLFLEFLQQNSNRVIANVFKTNIIMKRVEGCPAEVEYVDVD